MVSFQCDGCADTVKKPKLDQHRQRCWASFTCLDCSKTFQNQEYKSHTSCISEAEKYQGALYKGPRKGQQSQPPQPAPAPSTSTPQDPATSVAPAGIHPSRLNLMDTASTPYSQNFPTRGGPSGRGRGGAANRGRGAPEPRGGRGRFASVTGENKSQPEGGMRSWGSPAVTESAPASPSATPVAMTPLPTETPSSVPNGIEKKKKKRKGDKGGTGAKANSKRPKDDSASAPPPSDAEPAMKKRKRSTSPTVETPSAEISDKTLKRLRKNAGKVAEKSPSLSLGDWLKQVGEGKKEQVEVSDVNRAAKVSYEDGKWVLSF